MLWSRSCTIAPHRAFQGFHPPISLNYQNDCPKESQMRVRQFSTWVAEILIVVVSAIGLVLFCGQNLAAQQATALLTGTIKDSSGAVVPGAKVTLKNSDTNVSRTAN